MDLNLHNSNQAGPWTNEKHLHFLNSLEAAFVRTMFEDNGRLLRLDRYLPDSSESTLDLKSQRPKNNSTSVERNNIEGRRSRSVRRTKRLSSSYQSQPFDPSQDQVVPQLENRTSHKNERDHPIHNVEVAPVVPAN